MTGRALPAGDDSASGRVLQLAEWLIWRACQRLPDSVADERYREWTAELPAILDDPTVRFAPHRAAKALLFAADQGRGTRSLRQAGVARRTRVTQAAGSPDLLDAVFSGVAAVIAAFFVLVFVAAIVVSAAVIGLAVAAVISGIFGVAGVDDIGLDAGGIVGFVVVVAVVGIRVLNWVARQRGSGGRTPDGGA